MLLNLKETICGQSFGMCAWGIPEIKRRKEEMRQPEPVQVPQELAEETENEQIRATLRALRALDETLQAVSEYQLFGAP